MIFQADEELLERVRERARERGVSVAQVVRDALEHELGQRRERPRPKSIGMGWSDIPDLASREDLFVPDPWRSS